MADEFVEQENEALVRAIEAAASNAYGSDTDKELSRHRALAIDAYVGRNIEPAPEGRSQVTDWTVFETIQWILPSLTRIFAGGDNVVEFAPIGPDDEDKAEQESEYLNYLVTQKNNWFLTLLTWFQDALLTKNAYCMAFIEEKIKTEIESYEGQSEEALSLLLQDDVEVVGGASYPDPDDTEKLIDPTSGQEIPEEMQEQALLAFAQAGIEPIVKPPRTLYDVQLKSSKPCKKLVFKVLPPERVLVGDDTTDFTTVNCNYFEYYEDETISNLRAAGFEVDDDVGTSSVSDTEEDYARDIYNETIPKGESPDPSMRVVKARTIWIRFDDDGDGIAELMKVVMVGRDVLLKESASRIPVASIVPFLNTHRHMGASVADLTFDIQRIKTAILRGGLDSLQHSQNNRHAISNEVNLDDLMVSQPGGLVRMIEGSSAIPGQGHVMPLQTEFVLPQSLEGLRHMDTVVESRVGVNRIFQGIDEGQLNDHNRIGQLSTMAAQRVEQIARIFANGVEYLFSLAHELIIKSGHQAETVKLRGNWVDIDPSQWRTGRDMRVIAPFAAGNKDTLVARLLTIAQLQEKALAGGLPIVDASDAYNTAIELTKASDFPAPEKFWTDPSTIPPQEPPPDYTMEALKIEAQKVQNAANDSQLDAQTDKYKTDTGAEVDKYRADLQAEVQLMLAKIKAGEQVNLESVKASLKESPIKFESERLDEVGDVVSDLTERLQKAVDDANNEIARLEAAANEPKEVVRDKAGKVTGIKQNGKVKTVKRDKSGKVIGI